MKFNFLFFALIFLSFIISNQIPFDVLRARALNHPGNIDKILLQMKSQNGGNGPNMTIKSEIGDVKKMEDNVNQNITAFKLDAMQVIDNSTFKLEATVNRSIAFLNKTLNETFNTWNTSINWRNKTLFEDILKMTDILTDELKFLSTETLENLDTTVDLAHIILSSQILKKSDQVETINQEIIKLRLLLPPVKSLCELYFTCDSCAKNHNCGWCAATSKCINGDSKGPLDQICSYYNYGNCYDGGCGTITSCNVNLLFNNKYLYIYLPIGLCSKYKLWMVYGHKFWIQSLYTFNFRRA